MKSSRRDEVLVCRILYTRIKKIDLRIMHEFEYATLDFAGLDSSFQQLATRYEAMSTVINIQSCIHLPGKNFQD